MIFLKILLQLSGFSVYIKPNTIQRITFLKYKIKIINNLYSVACNLMS